MNAGDPAAVDASAGPVEDASHDPVEDASHGPPADATDDATSAPEASGPIAWPTHLGPPSREAVLLAPAAATPDGAYPLVVALGGYANLASDLDASIELSDGVDARG